MADERLKRPAFQFYPADWRKDVELRSCTLEARGFWVDLLCVAHECDPYGYLVVNGKPLTAAQMAGFVGATPPQAKRLLAELVSNGVARVGENGVIYSKRMVDDERLRVLRAEAGKLGGNPNLLNQKDNQKPKHPPKQKTTPSSSSSSASSSSNQIPPPDGVSLSVWSDFLKTRKAKKAAVTDTAMDGIRKEAAKAGMTLEAALAMCCKRGWQGFEAGWVKDQEREVSTVWHESAQGVRARAAELEIEEGDLEAFPTFKARVMAADRQGATA